ncbi:transferase 2, rSAM/selenodomain-associated [Aquiflexum balticum DSM 16537]|uniref:Transferase 2, rSAM/selenodomain-associated n=1 Tax=Aquiflexum balticum DSM 16537 TaxID=758820 RepID=A0A1W2H7V5_9BACT|nr:TIGR04283 family arsenosugar biosynthesis glycosyltransferase [Aquiflexum balticum]SMD44991.1 transferase 2, rSAM/selenodomain-associated [Aquiflexum balticum DSM 16537]
MKLSIIIPVLNESKNLQELLPFFLNHKMKNDFEVIVVDGGSSDDSVETAFKFGTRVVTSKVSSRACQMNLGARNTTGNILYFVHADVRLLNTFFEDIMEVVEKGVPSGCFAYSFDSDNSLLQVNSWFTQFNGILSGGGDQTLFVKRDVFETLGGFDENYCIMEDFEFVRRLKKTYTFHVIPKKITVSARKYENNSWMRVQLANLIVFAFFFLKIPPGKLKQWYYKLLLK